MTEQQEAAMRHALEALEVATTPLAMDRQEVLAAITALTAALEQPAIPRWKLVPVEPTEEMITAYDEAQYNDNVVVEAKNVWANMINAAPEPEQPAQQDPVGALILGGIVDTSSGPEYEDWDVEWNNKAVEALQERLVTGDAVTLHLYTRPQAREPLTLEQSLKQAGVCCGEYAHCHRSCTPRGRWEASQAREWVGLTEREQDAVFKTFTRSDATRHDFLNRVARAIEAKLKEKNER